LSQLI
jgi:Rho GDP-dissociation inhibitor